MNRSGTATAHGLLEKTHFMARVPTMSKQRPKYNDRRAYPCTQRSFKRSRFQETNSRRSHPRDGIGAWYYRCSGGNKKHVPVPDATEPLRTDLVPQSWNDKSLRRKRILAHSKSVSTRETYWTEDHTHTRRTNITSRGILLTVVVGNRAPLSAAVLRAVPTLLLFSSRITEHG